MIIDYNPKLLPVEYRVSRGGATAVTVLLAPVTTTDATPVTVWSSTLPAAGSAVRIWAQGHAVQSDGSNVYEFENRNQYRRIAGATSRTSPAGGQGTSMANTYAVTRPSIQWLDGTSNLAGLQIVGKAATTINWYITLEITANYNV